MHNFIAIYRILSLVEKALDIWAFEEIGLNHKALGVTEARFVHLLEMLVDDLYIKGVKITRNIDGYGK